VLSDRPVSDGPVGDRPVSDGPVGDRPVGDRPVAPRGRAWVRRALEFGDAIEAPLTRPVRSLLVLLAYVLGTAALIAAIGLTRATTGSVVAQLTKASSMELWVTGKASADQPWTAADPTADRSWASAGAAAARITRVEGVAAVFPVRTFTIQSNTVTRLRPSGSGTGAVANSYQGGLVVTTSAYLTYHHLTPTPRGGRTELLDNPWHGPVVAVGAKAASRLGIAGADAGTVVWVNGRPASVVAVLADSGTLKYDDALYFSPGAMAYLTDQLEAGWLVAAHDGYAEPLAKALPLALAPANPGQITVSTPPQLALLQQGINSDLGRLLGVIGAVILVLSTLTAATTMFLSVQHREAEIALRRAMGASQRSIWRLFVYEGLAIGIAGGVLGTGVGFVVTALVCHWSGWELRLGLDLPVLGVAVGLLAGAVASLVPALHAARRDPAGILRLV
jgi:macrolide transport system ATP-binding/permease protein